MTNRNPYTGFSVNNFDSALNTLSESMNEITAVDQLRIGITYFNAYHIQDNCSFAFKWIKLSAEQGNMEAQFKLAELYSLGHGTSKSHTAAYEWYTKAAIQGYKKALIRIHNLYQNDVEIHCRGKLNSTEELREKPYDWSIHRIEYQYRELNEQRLEDHKFVLNHAIDYYTKQFKKYISSNQEDPEVQQNLGFLYQHGYGVKKYDKWAIECYIKAAEHGYVDSQYQLACLYQKNTGIKFNYEKALQWYKLAAGGGNIAAQNRLAYFYEKGLGTKIDFQTALHWYNKAAESGHSEAQLNLGKWYRKGEYVDQNYEMAVKWYSLAARQGSKVAQNCLAQLYQIGKVHNIISVKDILEPCKEESKKARLCSKLQLDVLEITDNTAAEKLKLLAKHALIGDGNAMYQIGLKYYHGTDFIEDKYTGFQWIKKSADAGFDEAIIQIIKMYKEGDIVEQNYHKAAIWTMKNARKKSSKALCDLGVLYNEGRGVRNDPLEASKWFTLSADQGNSEAQHQLGYLRQQGRGLRRNVEEAREWFYLSAKQGNINGCYRFGMLSLYTNETGDELVYTGSITAIKLLEYSSNHGGRYAQFELWKFYHSKKEGSRADFYFDMLLSSNDVSFINEVFSYIVNSREYSVFEIKRIDCIKFYYLLKKAAELGILKAKEILESNIGYLDADSKQYLLQVFALVSDKGIASMEFNTGYVFHQFIEGEITDYSGAIYWYYAAAEKGDSRAQVQLGIICEEGRILDVNTTEAINYYTLAIEKENKVAMFRLACMYLEGRGVSQDLEKAFEIFTQASNMGHLKSREVLMLPCDSPDINNTEIKYFSQLSIEVNGDTQIKMLETMAELGLVPIQYQLGIFYENENVSKAIRWFDLAAKNGVPDACYKLGVYYEDGNGTNVDYLKAISFYERAILYEHEEALYRLAQIYLYGMGTDINYKKAYELYSRAAIMGHALSCKIIGFNLIIGDDPSFTCLNMENYGNSFDSSSSDLKHSLLMFQHLAEEGDVELQYKLGVIYDTKLDMQNYEEAVKWYSIAVNGSHREAMYRLGLLYESGFGVVQDYQKAIDLYNRAYKLGNYDALYKLGNVYHHGVATDLDPKKAVQCYSEAANNRHVKSQYTLGKLSEEGLLTKQDILEALRWYTKAYLNDYNPARTDLYNMYDDSPYEDYFFKKLNSILISASKRILCLNTKYYNDIYGQKYDELFGLIFYKLGIQYLCGNGITQDYSKALEYFNISETRYYNISVDREITNLSDKDYRDVVLERINMYETLFYDLNSQQQYNFAMSYYYGIARTDTNDLVDDPTCDNIISTGSYNVNTKKDIILPKDYKKALFYLEKITGEYSVNAHIQLAEMHIRGLGVEKNTEKAIEHYSSTSIDPSTYSFQLAIIYHFDSDFCDYSKAIEYYQRVQGFEQGMALNILGLFYKSGKGVSQDYKKAFEYFTASSDLYEKHAFYNLGLMYYNGQGLEKNYTEAYKWFKKASENDHTAARTFLENFYGVEKQVDELEKWFPKVSEKDNIGIVDLDFLSLFRPEAFEWYKDIEENDLVVSRSHISHCLNIDYSGDVNPSNNIEKQIITDLKEQHQRFMDSVESSEGVSLFFLGKTYYEGEVVEKDYKKAYYYFIKAAKANNSYAQYMLAEICRYGHGVDQDFEKAIEWYKKVDGHEKTNAFKNIGDLYVLKQDPKQALIYYKKSSELNILSALNIGIKYYYGDGVDRNYNEAYGFFNTAASQNCFEAQEMLAKMYLYGHGVNRNVYRAIEWYTSAASDDSDYSACMLGAIYHFADEIQDFSKALEWYQKVEGYNTSYALRGKGLLLEYGGGIDPDYQKSVECYQKSVDLDNKGGYYNLALMYYHGRGVDQDYKKCFSLLNESVKTETNINCMYVFVQAKGTSSISKAKEGRIYSHKNETELYGEVYYQLGIMHKNGQGTDQNIEEAKKYFLKAIENGNERAQYEGGIIFKTRNACTLD